MSRRSATAAAMAISPSPFPWPVFSRPCPSSWPPWRHRARRDRHARRVTVDAPIKNPPGGPRRVSRFQRLADLLDLAFLEFHVLARDGIVLPHRHLFGEVTRILLGHVVIARARGALELDLDGCGLRHGRIPVASTAVGRVAPIRGRTIHWHCLKSSR